MRQGFVDNIETDKTAHVATMNIRTGSQFIVSEDRLEAMNIGKMVTTPEDVVDAKTGKTITGHSKKIIMRLLAAQAEDSTRYGLELFVHYIKIGDTTHSILCPTKMKEVFSRYGIEVPAEIMEGRCPICEMSAERLQQAFTLKRENQPYQQLLDEAKKLQSYSYDVETKSQNPKQYLSWVIDEKASQKQILYYLWPSGLYRELIAKSSKISGGYNDFADYDSCFVLGFERTGKGPLDTKYVGLDYDKADTPVPEEFRNVPRYTDILVFKTYEEIAQIMQNFSTPQAESPEKVVEKKEEVINNIDFGLSGKPTPSALEKLRQNVAGIAGGTPTNVENTPGEDVNPEDILF
jgi:hypothetical protein